MNNANINQTIDKTIRTVTPTEFSPLLCQITDPPVTVRMQGTYPTQTKNGATLKYLTIVGARKYSDYGKAVCEQLIAGLRGYPIAIISGLALGIDGIALRASLSAGLPTIAVPGSGLSDRAIHPKMHAGIRDEILGAGGCVLSEFDDDFVATPYSFPQRNRIMAGLAHAVLVIEAELQSGTLITSKYATDYNRDVLTIPHSIFSKTSEGPHMLMRMGATPITKPADILEALGLVTHEGLFASDETSDSRESSRDYSQCSTDELAIITLLMTRPATREFIIRTCDKPIHATQALISILEIKGLIKEELGEIRLI